MWTNLVNTILRINVMGRKNMCVCVCVCVCSDMYSQSLSQFSCSVVSDSLLPHGLEYAWPPCPSPTPGVYPNSCPSSLWCHLTISFSVVPLSSCLQSFPASGSFPMSQFFASGSQSIGSFSFNISPSDEYSGLFSFRIDWLDPCSPRDSQESSPTPQLKNISSLALSSLYGPTLTSIHDYWENQSFD